MLVGHVCPEAADGGLIALLRDGDQITIDARKGTLSADISKGEIVKKRKAWKRRKISSTTGALAKHARLMSPASKAAITG